ncbi:hypothetical protein L208DRAFT_1402043, partial [Tricholoma matsutake]
MAGQWTTTKTTGQGGQWMTSTTQHPAPPLTPAPGNATPPGQRQRSQDDKQ